MVSRKQHFISFAITTLIYIIVGGILAYRNHNLVVENRQLKENRVIVYQVDNAGAAMFGKITDKENIDGRYTVTAGAYGKFLVTKKQYEAIKVGDEIPDFLKQRGMESNDVK